jgi:hypothetical protein
MKLRQMSMGFVICFFVMLLGTSPWVYGADPAEPDQPVYFTEGELSQMLAPIALYPDSLLSQILMASTYPLEVVMATRWVSEHKELKKDALALALEEQPWDPSVKSLVNFPQVLEMMNEKLEWTQRLGDAFLAQQEDVMNTVQRLRERAEEEGNLKTTREQKVIVERETQTIIIEPAAPTVIYVPVYDPFVVYGRWWYPAFPPFYYVPPYPPGFLVAGPRFFFWAGFPVGVPWGYAWGVCNWHRHVVFVDVHRHHHINRHIRYDRYMRHYGREWTAHSGNIRWQHNPGHRRGVVYRDETVARRYNRGTPAEAARYREQFRGRTEADRTSPRRDESVKSRVQQPRDLRQPGSAGQSKDQKPRQLEQPISRGSVVQPKDQKTRDFRQPSGVSSAGQRKGQETRRLEQPISRGSVVQPKDQKTRDFRQPSGVSSPGQRKGQETVYRAQPGGRSGEKGAGEMKKGGGVPGGGAFQGVDRGSSVKQDKERGRTSREGLSTGKKGETRGAPGGGSSFRGGVPGKR